MKKRFILEKISAVTLQFVLHALENYYKIDTTILLTTANINPNIF